MAVIRETLEIQDRFSAAFGSFISLGERMESAINRIDKSLDNYIQQQTEAAEKAENHGNKAKKATGDLSSFGSTIAKVAAALGGMAAVKGVIELSDKLTLAQSRLEAVNDGLQTTSELNDMIFASAQRARGSYLDTMQTVSSLAAQTRGVFNSTAETVRFAELLNKQFAISGTDANGIASTMYNLTQALSTGVLRGNDLQMVLSNSPALIQKIADYMGITIGELRNIASEGQITADIVKNAIMGAGDEIDAQFEKMPMTFGQAMQQVKNNAIYAFAPLRQSIADAVNSPEFYQAMNAISEAITVAVNIGRIGFTTLGRVIKFASENAQTLAPILGIIVGAITAYNVVMGISTALSAAHATITGVVAVAQGIYAAATAAATSGQSAFNAALAACPITWIVAAIIAAIAVVVALIYTFHELANTGHTVFGDIAGAVMGCFAVIQNALAIVANGFITAAEFIVNAWNEGMYNVQTFIYNFAKGAANAFNSVIDAADGAATALANAFIAGANKAISGINGIIDALNTLPGFDLGKVSSIGQVSSVISHRIDTSGLTAPTKASAVTFGRFETTSFSDAFSSGFDKGAAFGDNAQGNLTNALNSLKSAIPEFTGGSDLADLASSNNNLADAVGGGSGGGGGGGKTNVGTVDKVKNVSLSDEDVKLYRDLAERRYMANVELQTLAPNITVNVPAGQAQTLTAQDIVNKLKTILIEQAAAHTAVSHAN